MTALALRPEENRLDLHEAVAGREGLTVKDPRYSLKGVVGKPAQ